MKNYKITTRKVYNVKNKEVRIETYHDGEFFTDRCVKYNVENTNILPIQ